ncbi:YceI family protein [Photobacterium sanctipauli]|uniref:YceI family protein n=1 Tax=Photobacterium sanctipauli TaxID=1342794 RepID=A0A2T3NU63_9GAMM|nr:YceI family protein [Photobacterium sanctipauli]PSW19793.1 YceI family protein [Photobacterium sanctipauli]
MKKHLIALGIVAAASVPSMASAADYVIDTQGAHASINFKIKHLGYSYIKGRFNTFDGQFSYDPMNVSDSKVTVNVDTTSLDSNHAERDKHIRSDDFLDVKKFSTATFTSNKVEAKGNGEMAIYGELSLHGQTKPLVIDAKFIGEGEDPWGGYRAGFSGTTRIELADFGIQVMGESSYADIELHVEGIKQ